MQPVTAARRFMDRTVDIVCIALLAVMVAVVAAQVIWRYLLGAALPWSEELARFLFIWIIFLGAPIASRQGAHIGMDTVVNWLPATAKKYVAIVGDLVVLVFMVVMTISGWRLATATLNQPSPALSLPMGYVYASIPLGGLLMAVVTIGEIFAKVRSISAPSPLEAAEEEQSA